MQMFLRNDPVNSPQRVSTPLRIVTVLTIGLLLVAALALALSGGASKAHAAVTWNQIWNDEFNSTAAGSAPSSSNWLYDLGTSYPGGAGNWGTSEVESNTNSTANVYQDGAGHLAIKPIRSSSGSWTSGRIETQNSSFAAPAGGEMAVEASIQVPNVTGNAALGYWPAFWMLGSAFRGVYTNWPGVGEIDAMENVNGANKEYGTLHCGVGSAGPCNETIGLGGTAACTTSTCQAGFHTYRVEVDRSSSPEQIRWYLDGTQFWQVSSNNAGMDATTWSNAVDHAFFIILNVAIGGAFPNAICGCSSPSAATASGIPMLVDYVRVFTTAGGTTPTPTPTPTSSTCTGTYASGVVSSSSTSALPWFKACGWTAGYVILHYTTPNISQQNLNMTYNSSSGRWEYTVNNINPGQVLQYSFTYQKDGLQYDTAWTSWTHP